MEASRRTIGTLVRQRRLAKGLSLDALAHLARCAKSYLSQIENERRPGTPRPGVLARLEGALDMTPGTLEELAQLARTPGRVRQQLHELESRDRASRRLADLVNAGLAHPDAPRTARFARSLDDAYRSGELRALIDSLAPPLPDADDADELAPGAGGRSLGASARPVDRVLPLEVPLINSVAAGYPAEFTDLGYPARIADEYVRAPELHDPDAFAARVVGDSMLPEYREGDIVIFSPARPVRPGADCFVRLERDHESTFKRIFFQTSRTGGEIPRDADETDLMACQWIRLHPLNTRFPPRVVHREAVAGMYAAVSVTRPIL
jgi:transcriptional regulator with XRE-family HTH domain